MSKKSKLIGVTFAGLLVLTGCQVPELLGAQTESGQSDNGIQTSITEIANPMPEKESEIREFDIIADETKWNIDGRTAIEAWTYNGTVPGEEIRVTEGDFIRANLENRLEVPVTIHWHGMVLPNQMDGVAGVTQNAVQPGDTFTYAFQAKEAGTYWYHSHQQSSEQVDRGLYGAFIVEPKQKSYDRDQVIILDEWPLNGKGGSGMSGMMGGGDSGEMDSKMIYNTFTINGKTSAILDPIQVKNGETMRLRIINAGYEKHKLSLGDQPYRIVGNDGVAVENGAAVTDILEIAPGERIDVEFKSERKNIWAVHSVDDDPAADEMELTFVPEGATENNIENIPVNNGRKIVDLDSYGVMPALFTGDEEADLEYEMNLDAGMSMGSGMAFTVNGETFPDTEPIEIEKGDIVKVTLRNNSMLDHPMHLHGHHFQVVSKDGRKLETPLVKDLINVKPGEEYEIMFEANNPGHWVFHCHDLNHASGGMVSVVKYKGYSTPFELGGKSGNHPE